MRNFFRYHKFFRHPAGVSQNLRKADIRNHVSASNRCRVHCFFSFGNGFGAHSRLIILGPYAIWQGSHGRLDQNVNVCHVLMFCFIWSAMKVTVKCFFSLRHFGHLFHSCIKTHRNRVHCSLTYIVRHSYWNDLIFFGNFKKISVFDRKLTQVENSWNIMCWKAFNVYECVRALCNTC